MTTEQQKPCEHRYLTSYGKGWVCANRACGVGILSIAVPLPMSLVEEALRALGVKGNFVGGGDLHSTTGSVGNCGPTAMEVCVPGGVGEGPK